jgi:nitrate/nitrite transporter NarK
VGPQAEVTAVVVEVSRDNAAGAVAGIMSPVAFAWILQRTGSWTLPFAVSVCLLLSAIIMTYWIRPDRP